MNESIKERSDRLVSGAKVDTTIGTAIYTTMPLEDMINHSGEEMYDVLMLKRSCWRVISNTTFSRSHWRSCVENSIYGIVNSTASKHGVGKRYDDMRNTTMLGTMVIRDGKPIRIRSDDTAPVPVVMVPVNMDSGTCLSALTKMTVSMYQK